MINQLYGVETRSRKLSRTTILDEKQGSWNDQTLLAARMSYTDIFKYPLGFQLGLHMLQTLVLRALPSQGLYSAGRMALNYFYRCLRSVLFSIVKSTCDVFLFSFADLFSLDLFVRAELLTPYTVTKP